MSTYDAFDRSIKAIREIDYKDDVELQNLISGSSTPLIIRNLKSDWPVVQASKQGGESFLKYIASFDKGAPIVAFVNNTPREDRYFFSEDFVGFNFSKYKILLTNFLERLEQELDNPTHKKLYSGSNTADVLKPEFFEAHQFDLLADNVKPNLWFGNESRIAPHYDAFDNIAVNVSGERTFLLFPPQEISNLYMGPLFHTVAGAPTSIVDPRSVDTTKFPKFENALENAQMATLGMGDAIYIPFLWWHYVEGLSPVNMLINYWYNQRDMVKVKDCLMMAILAIKDLPIDDRKAIHSLFENFIFSENADICVDHLPPQAKAPFLPKGNVRDGKIIGYLKERIGKFL